MNIKAVASGGKAGNGGNGPQSESDKVYYSGGGGGGAGATLKYYGDLLNVTVDNGKVTLSSNVDDYILLENGKPGEDYTPNVTEVSGGEGGGYTFENENNSLHEINADAGNIGGEGGQQQANGFIAPTPPAGGTAGISYNNYGIGQNGQSSTNYNWDYNQSVYITYVQI